MNLHWIAILYFIMIVPSPSIAQNIVLNETEWDVVGNVHFTNYMGNEALYIYNGIATLKDFETKNAVIEFDMAFPKARGFTGLLWRIQDLDNYEEFYFRPHLSGKTDANQYNPVFNGNSAWQLYTGEGYAKAVEYNYDNWFHVKVISWEGQAQVYIEGKTERVVHISTLKHSPTKGQIGFKAQLVPTWFSNLKVTELNKPPFEKLGDTGQVLENRIESWNISEPFNEDLILGKTELPKNLIRFKVQKLESEPSGIINISQLYNKDDHNTVIAEFIINSEVDQSKTLNLGYSDRVKVFVNGNLAYTGNNKYLSRDYRYQGTIGLFDGIQLELKRGNNRIQVAVSEDFGGWGLIGQLQDQSGIRLSTE